MIQLISQILQAFKENNHTIGIFIDLSKAFDTVNHHLLLQKLELYGIKYNNLKWFQSYLSNRKQFIKFNNKNTNLEIIRCGIPQGSILGPLLFLIFVNDLQKSTKFLDPIMFADDTNLFDSNKDINTLLKIANEELNEMLILNNTALERVNYIKFLGVILDENINWNRHIEFVESKILKNIGILYRASLYLNKESLKIIYFSFINSYVSYCNIAWASTSKTKLTKQKHVMNNLQ